MKQDDAVEGVILMRIGQQAQVVLDKWTRLRRISTNTYCRPM